VTGRVSSESLAGYHRNIDKVLLSDRECSFDYIYDELDGFIAEQIIVMPGTNNLHLNTGKETIDNNEI